MTLARLLPLRKGAASGRNLTLLSFHVQTQRSRRRPSAPHVQFQRRPSDSARLGIIGLQDVPSSRSPGVELRLGAGSSFSRWRRRSAVECGSASSGSTVISSPKSDRGIAEPPRRVRVALRSSGLLEACPRLGRVGQRRLGRICGKDLTRTFLPVFASVAEERAGCMQPRGLTSCERWAASSH
jgi:hypothetical protein